MGMQIPLHVLVGELPSSSNNNNNDDEDDSLTWRSNLRVGSEIDFKSKDNTWREARVVEVSGTGELVIHCLGWVDKTSELYRINVSRDSPRVSRSHSHVRDWREQLRVSTPVEIHKSLMSDSLTDREIASKRPIYRCTTAKDPKGSSDLKTYYIHFVNGEWWLGAHLSRQHGYLYIKSYSKNPLELGGGASAKQMANEDDDGVFKYDDDTKRSAGNDDVKEDIFDDIDDVDDLGTWCSSVDFESITLSNLFQSFYFFMFQLYHSNYKNVTRITHS